MILETQALASDRPQVEVSLFPGRLGIIQTLKVMRDLARLYKKHPAIRDAATSAIAHIDGKQWRAEAEAVFEYVRSRVRYTLDIDDVEMLHTPDALLKLGFGDCDDMATLFAAMLLSIGHPIRFVAVGQRLHELSHVYLETLVGETWIPGDVTEPCPFGWAPQGVVSRYVMPV